MAKEPTSWATLFDDHALEVKPRERKVTSLLKSYRYANENFGAALSLMAVLRYMDNRDAGMTPLRSAESAFIQGMDDATLAANEDRVREFAAELPPERRDRAIAQWLEFVRTAASNQEDMRD